MQSSEWEALMASRLTLTEKNMQKVCEPTHHTSHTLFWPPSPSALGAGTTVHIIYHPTSHAKRDLVASITGSNQMSTTPSSACQRECTTEQKAVTSCVESIRAARENGDDSTTSATPQCLAGAVQAWTRCCEEANLRETKDWEFSLFCFRVNFDQLMSRYLDPLIGDGLHHRPWCFCRSRNLFQAVSWWVRPGLSWWPSSISNHFNCSRSATCMVSGTSWLFTLLDLSCSKGWIEIGFGFPFLICLPLVHRPWVCLMNHSLRLLIEYSYLDVDVLVVH